MSREMGRGPLRFTGRRQGDNLSGLCSIGNRIRIDLRGEGGTMRAGGANQRQWIWKRLAWTVLTEIIAGNCRA